MKCSNHVRDRGAHLPLQQQRTIRIQVLDDPLSRREVDSELQEMREPVHRFNAAPTDHQLSDDAVEGFRHEMRSRYLCQL